MNNIKHSSQIYLFYSPPFIVERARATLGGIDLDPASDQTGQSIIHAEEYFSMLGLVRNWWGKVFLNPPGGKLQGKSSQKLYWEKLQDEYLRGNVEAAIFLGFSAEIAQSSQNCSLAPATQTARKCVLDFPCCFLKKRISFLDNNLEEKKSPTHSNVIAFLPPKGEEKSSRTVEFYKHFSHLGKVVVPFDQE